MPRRKSPQQRNVEEQNSKDEYALQFAMSMVNSMTNGNYFMNPFLQNQILKNINMSPRQFDRDKVEELMKNPQHNEEALRDLAQFLYNYVLHFKRVIHYFSSILTFDYLIKSTGSTKEDKKSRTYKNNRKKVADWIESFNPKKVFPEILRRIIGEDTMYYYVRESDSGVQLQEMPNKYCKIIRKTDFGYQYSFNMMYFLQVGVDINDYAPEFKEYFAAYTQTKEYKNQYPFWMELDPIKAPVFKFDENFAASIPPLMGLFIDTVEIASYKDLLKTKTSLDTWKLLISKIPLMNDGKTNAKNNFAIDADQAGKFNTIVNNALPQGVKSVVSPFETEAIDFKNSETKNDIAGIGEEMFYRSAGVSPVLFGTNNTTASGITGSQKVDEAFVKHLYFMFERFINTQIERIVGKKYKFRIKFNGTIFDQEQRYAQAIQAVQFGAPKVILANSLGYTLEEFEDLLDYEDTIGILDKMTPLQSSHTQSLNKGGAPTKSQSELSDAGEHSKDAEVNNNS